MIEDKGSTLLPTRSNKTANIDDKSSNVQVSDTTKDARRITACNKNFLKKFTFSSLKRHAENFTVLHIL